MLFTRAGRSTNNEILKNGLFQNRIDCEFFRGTATVAMNSGPKLATDLQGNDDKTRPSLVRLVVHRRLRADIALDVPPYIRK